MEGRGIEEKRLAVIAFSGCSRKHFWSPCITQWRFKARIFPLNPRASLINFLLDRQLPEVSKRLKSDGAPPNGCARDLYRFTERVLDQLRVRGKRMRRAPPSIKDEM